YLEPRHETHIRRFRITPDIDAGTVGFSIACMNANDDCQVEIVIWPFDGSSQTALLEVRNGQAERTIKLSALSLWEPNTPNLYNVVLRLRCKDEIFDSVRSYFGMRKI